MRMLRHPDPTSSAGPTGDAHPAPSASPDPADPAPTLHRFNLLLSYAGWESDPWVNRLPTLLQPMGVRSYLAASGQEASRVIRQNAVHVAIVDLGLPFDAPDAQPSPSPGEGGPRLLQLLARLDAPPPTLVIKRRRTTRDDQREIAAALRAGAFAVLDRPRDTADLEIVLEVLRRILQRHYANRWPAQNTG